MLNSGSIKERQLYWGRSLQEKLVILIIDFVTAQQLRVSAGNLGAVSRRRSGGGLVTAGPTRLQLENIKPGL